MNVKSSGSDVSIDNIYKLDGRIGDIFAGNSVAGVFVLSMILNFILPKDMDVKKLVGMQ